MHTLTDLYRFFGLRSLGTRRRLLHWKGNAHRKISLHKLEVQDRKEGWRPVSWTRCLTPTWHYLQRQWYRCPPRPNTAGVNHDHQEDNLTDACSLCVVPPPLVCWTLKQTRWPMEPGVNPPTQPGRCGPAVTCECYLSFSRKAKILRSFKTFHRFQAFILYSKYSRRLICD